uniref:Uncharacterized protein n=1 Tax=Pristionchus pacificus TaxID=54126 RepID=A0A2A6CMN8_PRIPA|eukprot:PDM79360.1 hypothetical protein PRIPAC_31939 [Pristionchus pacificus]
MFSDAAVVAVAGAAGLVAVVVVEVVAIPHLAGPQLTSVEAVTMAVATAVEAAGEITQYGYILASFGKNEPSYSSLVANDCEVTMVICMPDEDMRDDICSER